MPYHWCPTSFPRPVCEGDALGYCNALWQQEIHAIYIAGLLVICWQDSCTALPRHVPIPAYPACGIIVFPFYH